MESPPGKRDELILCMPRQDIRKGGEKRPVLHKLLHANYLPNYLPVEKLRTSGSPMSTLA